MNVPSRFRRFHLPPSRLAGAASPSADGRAGRAGYWLPAANFILETPNGVQVTYRRHGPGVTLV